VSQLSIPQALQIALEHHFAGRVREAEALYRQVLSRAPQNPEARQLLAALTRGFGPHQPEYFYSLGVVLSNAGRPDQAIPCYQQALRMNPAFVEAHYNLGNALAMMGDFASAIECYRRTLQIRPDFERAKMNLARAYNDRGAMDHRSGRIDAAIEAYRQAIELAPEFADALSNLGNALGAKGQWPEAIELCRRALALRPDYAQAWFNLANALRETGKTDEAIDGYRRAVELKPDFVEAQGNLGVALASRGKVDEAIACHEKALALRPGSAEAHSKLAVALVEAGRLNDAVSHGRSAVQIDPNSAEACHALGMALAETGQVAKAIELYQRAIALRPDFAEAHNSLGLARQNRMEVDHAISSFKSAITIRPNYADAYNNFGTALLDTGQAPAAVEAYRKAVECKPDFHQAHSNLVATLYFDPNFSPQKILAEHRRWAQMHGGVLSVLQAHPNNRDSERRLRIGYASPNFRKHVVGLFLQPLFEKHEHSQFEIVCFSDTRNEDDVTGRLKGWADEWHVTKSMTDEAMVDFIRSKSIDILVDLNLHMAYERMRVFARKPAPIQTTYLAYAGTSGLEAMDYRLTDGYLDPPGENDSYYSEESVRLKSYWCYRPWDVDVAVGELPALKNGYVTFGCLNNTAKDSDEALELWGKVMQAVPNSRLIVSAFAGSPRERILRGLATVGVEAQRVEFVGWMELKDYLRTYGDRIDLGLDPIPYNGGTTTCDALWMGVPMITLAGKLAVGRAGVTLMNQVGLAEFIAESPENYVRIASQWARDLTRLAAVRGRLRQRVLASPLCDAESFARDVEEKYRWMWRRWCS